MGCLLLLLPGCSKKTAASIVGNWHDNADNSSVEFRSDGTLTFTQGDYTASGTFKFSDPTHMTAIMNMPVPPQVKRELKPGTPDSLRVTTACVVKMQGDEMDVDVTMFAPGQDSRAQSMHLTRVK